MADPRQREQVVINATPVQWAYLAGFIDGEGCITTRRQHSTERPRPMLTVVQRYPPPLYYLQSIFGGSLNYYGRWTWRLTGGRLETVLLGIQPLLVLKQEQADLALALLDARGDVAKKLTHHLKLAKRPAVENWNPQ